jgi:hypothetical protein
MQNETTLVVTMVQHVERKAISPGTNKSLAQPTLPWLHLFSVVSPLCRVGNPLSIHENLFLDYPVTTSTSLFFHILHHSTILQFSKQETHIHYTSNTYVPFPLLFAEGKSLKSEGIGMPRDKNKGVHGDLSGPCRTNRMSFLVNPSCLAIIFPKVGPIIVINHFVILFITIRGGWHLSHFEVGVDVKGQATTIHIWYHSSPLRCYPWEEGHRAIADLFLDGDVARISWIAKSKVFF